MIAAIVVISIVAVGAFIAALMAAGIAVKRMEEFMEDRERGD